MTVLSTAANRASRLLTLLLLCLLAVAAPRLSAQTVNASIGGIVSDQTGARLAGAAVVLVNDKSHDERKSKSNRDGVFQFNAVPTGTYTLTVTQQGFETLNEKGIELHPNDVRTLSEIRLQLGEVSTNVDVTASDSVPTSGERSSLITANDISKLSTVGRDVSELLKTQAGFSVLQSGLDNGGGSDPSVVGTGGGLGNYVGNGATGNGASIISDGANVTDPGNGSGQTQTVNMDMVAEVKIETSNFGADTAKGPTVITAVGKSGGSSYHGSVYAFGRTAKLNAEDWYLKFVNLPPIQDHYVYPGFNIGGPVLIPGTSFNHNKKLVFFLGAEDYVQRNVYAYGSPLRSYIQALVPTDQSTNPNHEPGMRQGNFSQDELSSYVGTDSATVRAQCNPSGTLVSYLHVCGQPSITSTATTGPSIDSKGMITNLDPGAAALLKEFPLPTGPTVNGYNYSQLNLTNPDVYQARTRIDYGFSDNNKLYGVFNTEQSRTTAIPEQIYYSPASGGIAQGGLDTPGKITSTGASNTGSANYTHIFNARATNEIFGAVSYVSNYYASGNPAALLKSTVGYPYQGVYNRSSCPGCGSEDIPQLATYGNSRSGLPLAITPDFSNGRYLSKKFIPSAGDNFSFLLKSHTLKFGVYFEKDTADQTDLSPITNGQLSSYYLGTNNFNDAACAPGVACHPVDTVSNAFTGQGANYLADFFLGAIGSFQQQNFNPKTNLSYVTLSWFATDSWKATKRLTVDYGIRFDHLGPWYDNHGLGIATFSPAIYQTEVAAGVQGYALPGVRWHGGSGRNTDPNTPTSGSPSRFAFYSPRFGLAFDAFGTGRTVMRGGLGFYRAHDSWNDYQYPAGTAEGLITQIVGGAGAISLAGIDAGAPGMANSTSGLQCSASSTSACPTISALDPRDSQQPLTATYSFTVTQQLPRNAVFEIAYVGNQSHDLLSDATSPTTQSDLQNINAIPLGALFLPDPNPKSMALAGGVSNYGMSQQPTAASTAIQNDYRPFTEYTDIQVPRHIAYANYNALQVSLNRQKGKLNYGLNYTWSRAQGVRGGYNNGLSVDPTNFRANYGPLGFDRTNIANASYSYDEGNAFHLSRFGNAIVNGWFLSGITNLQSGPNLQAVYSPNLQLTGTTTTSANGAQCGLPTAQPGVAGISAPCTLDNRTLLGTPDIYLEPILKSTNLCPSGNPGTNLGKHQYVNGACFGIGPQGVNGPTNLGYLRGPAFFSSDLSAQRRVKLSESRALEFRVSAFNFLNHPITAFNSHQTDEASLVMGGTSFATAGIVNGAPATNADSTCNVPGSHCFGYAGYKTSRRVMEMSARFNF